MEKPFSIRLAQPGDAAEWARLRQQLWPDGDHLAEVQQYFDSASRDTAPVFLAESAEDGVVGFAEVTTRADYVDGVAILPVPYLEGWYVTPEFRGRDVGRALIAAAEAWAAQRGFREMASDAEISNAASISAHRACGFVEVIRTVHFIKYIDAAAARE